jgi:hypothetical protein
LERSRSRAPMAKWAERIDAARIAAQVARLSLGLATATLAPVAISSIAVTGANQRVVSRNANLLAIKTWATPHITALTASPRAIERRGVKRWSQQGSNL